MKKLGIYIHIPFCVKKCDYCDFLSAPAGEETMRAYVDALKNEIKLYKEKMSEYLIDTVFIGGGTPSILDGRLIMDILDSLRKSCSLSEEAEITIECNPGTVTKEKLMYYHDAGINRLSLGLQSAKNEELKTIGRIHTYEDFLESYRLARQCGFWNINIDLMSALPGQTIESYMETLEKVISLKPEHISAYSLIVEEGTPLKSRVEGALNEGIDILSDEEDERKMYHLTKDFLEKAGYYRYEISNYAKIGYECKHNIGYWKRKEYLGFGIGAASLYKEMRYSNIRDINQYTRVLENESGTDTKIKDEGKNNKCVQNGFPMSFTNAASSGDKNNKCMQNSPDCFELLQRNHEILSKKEQMAEYMFLGLRMIEGVSEKDFKETFGKTVEDVYGEVIKKLVHKELLEKKNEFIRLTERGVDISNYVMAEFV